MFLEKEMSLEVCEKECVNELYASSAVLPMQVANSYLAEMTSSSYGRHRGPKEYTLMTLYPRETSMDNGTPKKTLPKECLESKPQGRDIMTTVSGDTSYF